MSGGQIDVDSLMKAVKNDGHAKEYRKSIDLRPPLDCSCIPAALFLAEEHLYRTSEKVEFLAQSVLDEPPVRFAYVLRKIAEKCE